MELIKSRTMPGVMELQPYEQIAFQNMLGTIRRWYERFGFLPIETPAMEFVNILLTKSGGETERQVYFVQSTGSLQQQRTPDLALRFDLTVPLARFVAEHEHQLNFPFRRYQIQRVYRGESAQRGRFREFYQCDIDVIGKNKLSLRFDAEIPMIIYQIFRELNLGKFTININNRKLMKGLFASMGIIDAEQQTLVLREVDKLDKRGRDKVVETLTGERFNLAIDVVEKIMGLITLDYASNQDCLDQLGAMSIEDELFREGLDELGTVVQSMAAMGVPEEYYRINLSIARGLDYYTGTVYETLLDDHPEIGSVCSGGRYDNLAGHYTKSHLPGVGISIGATRLFYQMREIGIIETAKSHVQALVTRMDESLDDAYLALAADLRQHDINTEVWFEKLKFGKQLKYADKAGIRFAIIMGRDELDKGVVTVKDLHQSEQFEIARDQLADSLAEKLGLS